MTNPKDKVIIVGGQARLGRALIDRMVEKLGKDVYVVDQDTVKEMHRLRNLEVPEVSAHPERRKPKKPKRRRLKRKPGGKL